jgi:D-lactate dehydrogenase
VHVKNLKPSPAANELVNRCIECGFCESNCPSKDITLTPRQRIAVYKELFRLRSIEDRTSEQQSRLDEMTRLFEYGADTCAADGMCQVRCNTRLAALSAAASACAGERVPGEQRGYHGA